MEAIKPLIVLVLFGTILYGAYSVVQKGPSTAASPHADASEAPAFQAPTVELPAAPSAVGPAPPSVPPFVAAAQAAVPPAPVPPGSPPPSAANAATDPFSGSPSVPQNTAAPPTVGIESGPSHSLVGGPALTAAAVGGVAAGAVATAIENTAASTMPPAAVNDAPPTYLAAESAPPPGQNDVPVPSGTGEDRPQRLATLSTSALPPTSLSPGMQPPPGSLPSSAAFATAWSDAHDKLTAGRYAEALTALSVWYDDPSLGLEESHRLEDLLGQLAGTVIYSQQDLLLPPHVVAEGETLPAIAAQLGVSWQLLAKINGVSDPLQLLPGEHLKLIRGPFDAVVSISRRRVSLQLGGAYAGSFPVVIGREFLPRVGSSLPVAEIRRQAVGAGSVDTILLADGVRIDGADDPAVVADDAAPASLVVASRDLDELLDILGPGSKILIRQ